MGYYHLKTGKIAGWVGVEASSYHAYGGPGAVGRARDNLVLSTLKENLRPGDVFPLWCIISSAKSITNMPDSIQLLLFLQLVGFLSVLFCQPDYF